MKEKSKYMVFIESNTTGSGMLALEKAKEMGFTPVLISNNIKRYHPLPHINFLTYECDTNLINDIIKIIETQLGSENIIGITTTSEFYITMVARLCVLYKLSSNSVESLEKCRNKSITREIFKTNAIKQPRFRILEKISSQEVKKASDYVKLPCVVKPVADTGSNQVRLCLTLDDVFEATKSIINTPYNVRGQVNIMSALVEEYIDSQEYSVEMFSWNGVHSLIGVTKKTTGYLPNFVELKHIFPTEISPMILDEIKSACVEVLDIMEIRQGPTHIEIKVTNDGIYFIEINARLAGGMIPELIQLTTGRDILKEQLKSVCNIKPDLPNEYKFDSGIAFITTEKRGIFEGYEIISDIHKINGIEHIEITKKVGDLVKKPENSYDRLGFIIVKGTSEREVEDLLSYSLSQIKINVK